jgi:hypothetical protein
MKKATESRILWPSISLGITKTDQRTCRITLGDRYCNEILPICCTKVEMSASYQNRNVPFIVAAHSQRSEDRVKVSASPKDERLAESLTLPQRSACWPLDEGDQLSGPSQLFRSPSPPKSGHFYFGESGHFHFGTTPFARSAVHPK